jgi:hypothetical protein
MMDGSQAEIGQEARGDCQACQFDAKGVRPLQTPGQASVYLSQLGIRLAIKTLANLRSAGGGPSFLKLRSGKILYSTAELQCFVSAQICFSGDSTSTLKPLRQVK